MPVPANFCHRRKKNRCGPQQKRTVHCRSQQKSSGRSSKIRRRFQQNSPPVPVKNLTGSSIVGLVPAAPAWKPATSSGPGVPAQRAACSSIAAACSSIWLRPAHVAAPGISSSKNTPEVAASCIASWSQQLTPPAASPSIAELRHGCTWAFGLGADIGARKRAAPSLLASAGLLEKAQGERGSSGGRTLTVRCWNRQRVVLEPQARRMLQASTPALLEPCRRCWNW